MRWLKSSEDGAVAAVFAVMLLVLLGMAALVVDIGDGYWERRMLQNSADAAALAVAGDCVQGDCGAFTATANNYATANNQRGAYVPSVTGLGGGAPTPTGGQVTVVTTTGDSAAPGRLEMFFAGALGREEGLTASARATAAWAATTQGKTIPLTFSTCEWDLLTGGLGRDALPTTEPQIIQFKDPLGTNVCDGPAGLDFPGGFGWLDTVTDSNVDPDAGNCIAIVSEGLAPGKVGASTPQPAGQTGCTADFFRKLVEDKTELLLPVHESYVGGPGQNAQYTIVGFTGLIMTGFKLANPPDWTYPPSFACPSGPGDSPSCIEVLLVDYYDVNSVPRPGGTEFGSMTFGLIE